MTTTDTRHSLFTRHSRFSDPGRSAAALDTVPPSLADLHRTATGLVFHYRGGGDWAAQGVLPARISEVDTRYADLMLDRLLALRPGLTAPRSPADRVVGCCRDFTLLLLTLARHHGLPARARVGFATYFSPGWFVDHAVAEVWDAAAGRWRLVDAQLPEGYPDPADGAPLDVLDLPPGQFLTGASAWQACRAGRADPERFVVDPSITDPPLRSWPYLAHNLRLDLAALGREELVLWDDYGPLAGAASLTPAAQALLDDLAALTADPDPDPEEVAGWLGRDEFRVPSVVTSYSPAAQAPREVTLRP